jgi:plastocyanin
MTDDSLDSPSRRRALGCLAYGGAGTLFMLAGGVFTPLDLAVASADPDRTGRLDRPLFVQLSDTHIGFNKDANPDVDATFTRAIDLVNAMPEAPALVIHTGDITHLSRPAEFDRARQLFSRIKAGEMHTVPGEHDTSDAAVSEYFSRFGKASNNKGYYSFDHAGVHFIALVNVLQFKPGGLGSLGADQLAWVEDDLKGRAASMPIVVFAHMPLWSVYEPWGWGTGDAPQLLAYLRRFGSVTVLNGHIPQIVQSRRQRDLPHRALDRLSAARARRRRGARSAQGSRRSAGRRARHPQRDAGQASAVPRARGPDARMTVRGVLAAALLGALCAARAGAADGDTIQVSAKNFMFTPATLTVQAGTTVTWVDLDDEPHTVSSDAGLFRSSALDTKERFSFKFDKAGTYHYLCTIHPQMLGTVVVE